MNYSTLDIFCTVVDNYGDIGVVFRFARDFKHTNPDIRVRVFIDNLTTFKAIKHEIDTEKTMQEHDSIIYIDSKKLTDDLLLQTGVANVIVETFACEIPEIYMKRAYYESILLINLEHLSAEHWVEKYHLKESFLPEGTLKKFYFMPGFTQNTGGIIINSNITFEKFKIADRLSLINSILPQECFIEEHPGSKVIIGSVFTYTRGLNRLIQDCISLFTPTLLLISGEKSINSIEYAVKNYSIKLLTSNSFKLENLTIIKMPFLPQQAYDTLLKNTDFNIVRGEDSLVRAILAGKPFVWNAYIQDSNYQIVKAKALCEMMRKWFADISLYEYYKELTIEFNSAPNETPKQVTQESFVSFFENLKKIEHLITEMSYFMTQNCNLVKNFSTFIRDYPYITI